MALSFRCRLLNSFFLIFVFFFLFSDTLLLPNICLYDNDYQLIKVLSKGEVWDFQPVGQAKRLTLTDCGPIDLRYGYTLFEFTVTPSTTYYDISLVDGYSVPLSVRCSSNEDESVWTNLCYDDCDFTRTLNTCSSPCKISPNVEDCCLPPKYQGNCPSNNWKTSLLNRTGSVYLQPYDDSSALHMCQGYFSFSF
uniref:P22 n=1 Tax=Olive leaf mottling virus TaxID=3162628 RepID=A0AAU7NIK4_9CLOS